MKQVFCFATPASDELTELGNFELPFDDVANGLAPGSSTTKLKVDRRRRASVADLEVMATATTLSPEGSLEGMPVPTPNRRRSKRLRRQSVELHKAALERRKQMEV